MTKISHLIAAVVALVLAACASNSAKQQTTVTGDTSQANSTEYIIGPGDTLRIAVLRNPELNVEVPVRPDGKLSAPLVNDVTAVGKTPTQLAKEIETALAEYVRSPSVSVMVILSTSRFSQVKVVGQAVNPRAVSFRSGMTVLDLIIEVGGLSEFAAGNRAKIIREETPGKAVDIPVRLSDLLNKGRISENVPLKAGDILVIPETLF